MLVTLRDAARLLGWSDRQVRYALSKGRLSGRKVEGRWQIDADALPLSDGQRRARARKADDLRQHVEAALGPRSAGTGYSVRSLTAFSAATRLARDCAAALGEDHAGTRALGHATVALARGCHRFGAAKLSQDPARMPLLRRTSHRHRRRCSPSACHQHACGLAPCR